MVKFIFSLKKLIRREIIFQFYLIYNYAGDISNKNIVDTY